MPKKRLRIGTSYLKLPMTVRELTLEIAARFLVKHNEILLWYEPGNEEEQLEHYKFLFGILSQNSGWAYPGSYTGTGAGKYPFDDWERMWYGGSSNRRWLERLMSPYKQTVKEYYNNDMLYNKAIEIAKEQGIDLNVLTLKRPEGAGEPFFRGKVASPDELERNYQQMKTVFERMYQRKLAKEVEADREMQEKLKSGEITSTFIVNEYAGRLLVGEIEPEDIPEGYLSKVLIEAKRLRQEIN